MLKYKIAVMLICFIIDAIFVAAKYKHDEFLCCECIIATVFSLAIFVSVQYAKMCFDYRGITFIILALSPLLMVFDKPKLLFIPVCLAIIMFFHVAAFHVDKTEYKKNYERIEIGVRSNNNNVKGFVTGKDEIRSLFAAKEIEGPIYSDGMYMYILSKTPAGEGVAVIDSNDGTDMKFYSFKEKPSKQVDALMADKLTKTVYFIEFLMNEVPYAKYAIFEEHLFTKPKLVSYILINTDGNIQEYSIDDLPDFAK